MAWAKLESFKNHQALIRKMLSFPNSHPISYNTNERGMWLEMIFTFQSKGDMMATLMNLQ